MMLRMMLAALLAVCSLASAEERHGLPPHLFTGDPSASDSQARLQVDDAETGFFEAREFRVTRKIRLAAGEEVVFKNVIGVDFIIQRFQFSISEGNYEVHVWGGDNVTEGITFTETITPLPKNGSSEFREYDGARYQTDMQIWTSGAVTAGTAITVTDTDMFVDYLEMKSANATGQSSGGISPDSTFRYAPAGTFYTQVTNIGQGSVRGVINNEWEERPPENNDWLIQKFGRYD